jgi:hypothetical protein
MTAVVEMRFVGLRAAVWRLMEGLMLSAGGIALTRFGVEKQELLAVTNLPVHLRSPWWTGSVLVALGVFMAIGGLAALVEGGLWLAVLIVQRGPFVVCRKRNSGGYHMLRYIPWRDVEKQFIGEPWLAATSNTRDEGCDPVP